jgi:hypothetical protein
LPFIISILSIFSKSLNAQNISHNFQTDNETKKIVQRYNIDTSKHRVIGIDYLEFHPKNIDAKEDEIVNQKVRDYIKKLDFKEKHDIISKKLNFKPDYSIESELKNNPNVISLSNENINKKSVNDFNFHIFCINSKMEECEKYIINLNSVGESFSSQLVIKQPINIFVKVTSFCNNMGKDCGAIKTYATSTPSAFYALTEELDDMPYLYPQSLVKQLNLDGEIDYLKYDISITINSDINYWFWSDKDDIKEEQIDFQQIIAKEIVHGLGFVSSLSQTLKQDYSSIFNIISKHKEHPYLLPYFHYGSNGYFNAPIVKSVLPLFIYDKYLNIKKLDNYTPIWHYLTSLYESDIIESEYVSLAVKRIEENYDIYEGVNYLYNYAEESQWVFNQDDATVFQELSNSNEKKTKSIPIDTFIFNEWINGLSGSHVQCDSFYHSARSQDDGIMCAFSEEGVKFFEKNSKLLTNNELIVLSTIGWQLIKDEEIHVESLPFDEENGKEQAVEDEIEEVIEDEIDEILNGEEKEEEIENEDDNLKKKRN